jgi:hypothetical protein
MAMDNARIDMPYTDFHNMQLAADEATRTIAKLQEELTQLKVQGISATDAKLGAQLVAGILSARTVVLFAMGQLPAETTKGWPVYALRELAKALELLAPLLSNTEGDLPHHARDLLAFVKEVEIADAEREAMRQVAAL